MELAPFLLNDWLERPRDLKFNLAGSAGPRWTMTELLQLRGGGLDLTDLPLSYAPTAGAAALRAEIAAHHNVVYASRMTLDCAREQSDQSDTETRSRRSAAGPAGTTRGPSVNGSGAYADLPPEISDGKVQNPPKPQK